MKSKSQRKLDLMHDGRATECISSSRYLIFHKPDQHAIKLGHPVAIDVMVNNYGDKPDRKLCELVLTVEAIEAMGRMLSSEILVEDHSKKDDDAKKP